jgi:hypothetical protein
MVIFRFQHQVHTFLAEMEFLGLQGFIAVAEDIVAILYFMELRNRRLPTMRIPFPHIVEALPF